MKKKLLLKALRILVLALGILGLACLLASLGIKHPSSLPARWAEEVATILIKWGGWGAFPFFAFLLVLGLALNLGLGTWIIPFWASLAVASLVVDLVGYLLHHPLVSGRLGVWLGSKMREYLGPYGLWLLVILFSLGAAYSLKGDWLVVKMAKGAAKLWRMLWGKGEIPSFRPSHGKDQEEETEKEFLGSYEVQDIAQEEETREEKSRIPLPSFGKLKKKKEKKEVPTLEVVLSKKKEEEHPLKDKEEEEKPLSPPPSREGEDLPPSSRAKLKIREASPVKQVHKSGGKVGRYRLPPIDLLDPPPPSRDKADRSSLEEKAALLEEKLSNYGVTGKVVSIHYGPVVTMFEFQPAPGVKVSRIANLSDDIAMAMKALGVRIVAPIPGKDVVGIEIPNDHREAVYFREIVGSNKFKASSSPLTMALGKDIFGKPFVADLKKMPHLLVAGATGSGKSVGLNTIICSILYKSTPQEVKFIMVDPKMLEFSVYNGVPHLITPVITDPRKAASALGWAVTEMERRYALLTQWGVRNIEGYNRMAEEPLPYIVVVIDELADLMMVAAKDVETLIARLAQKARAAGIHLVVATQRPSVDVITGLIKANFPSRISFKVTSKVDSRTILDTMGAEKLLGMGDMLFLPPGSSDLVRLHGAYISDKEILRVASFWQEQEEPQFDEEIVSRPVVEGGNSNGLAGGDMGDELYPQAVELVVRTGYASASMIQRYLKIGYNRAARLIERMEKEGVVGPAQGSKPREVLLTPQDLEREEG